MCLAHAIVVAIRLNGRVLHLVLIRHCQAYLGHRNLWYVVRDMPESTRQCLTCMGLVVTLGVLVKEAKEVGVQPLVVADALTYPHRTGMGDVGGLVQSHFIRPYGAVKASVCSAEQLGSFKGHLHYVPVNLKLCRLARIVV